MILFLIATGLQFLTTLSFLIFYQTNPLPANIAESRRQKCLSENEVGKAQNKVTVSTNFLLLSLWKWEKMAEIDHANQATNEIVFINFEKPKLLASTFLLGIGSWIFPSIPHLVCAPASSNSHWKCQYEYWLYYVYYIFKESVFKIYPKFFKSYWFHLAHLRVFLISRLYKWVYRNKHFWLFGW